VKKIAVVEDNPDNRLLVRVILEPLYEVCEYENGRSALEGLPREKADVVLLDISLPEMDGMEVLGRIRATPELRGLPVIALTAHAMAGDRDKYLGLGFDDYVTKPIVDESVLLGAIQRKLAAGQPAPDAAPQETGFMNSSALERLRRLGGDSFAAEMIRLFLDYTAQKIVQGRQAHAAGDLAGIQKAMHPINSSAGNVGAGQIQELAARIEDLAKKQQGESLGALLAEIDNAFALAAPRFEQLRQSLLNQ